MFECCVVEINEWISAISEFGYRGKCKSYADKPMWVEYTPWWVTETVPDKENFDL